MAKIHYGGSEDPTPCEVCGTDTLDGSWYCSVACEDYATQYWEDIEHMWVQAMMEGEDDL